IVLGATGYLYVKIPKGFIPDQDNDQMYVNTEAAQGTSFREMETLQQRVNDILRKDPYVESFNSSVGGMGPGGPGSGNQARMFVQLKPRTQRKPTSAQVIEELRPKLSSMPGMRVFMNLPPVIRIGGRMSKSSYELTVQGPDTADLYREADKLQQLIARLPAVN